MSAPQQSHPRRRPIKGTASPLSTHAMQLRKSGTFSSPTSVSSDVCDLDNHQYMPRRSPTSTERLEELVEDSGVQRVANLLKAFDKKFSGRRSSANILADPEVLPVPGFILANTHMGDNTPMDVDSKTAAQLPNHEHASDSGLGSSISGSKYDQATSSTHESVNTSVSSTHAAITRSFSAMDSSEEKHTLGEHACKQIHDHIIKPILADDSLKEFHPLIKDVPRRIGEKNICNLRDLEKTLVFLAPELSATPTSYLRFCEQSIRLLHTTVDCLSEQDQRLPSDRPYTNNYFLDLIEQIRRYAAIMAASRQKEANGEELDEMDYSPYVGPSFPKYWSTSDRMSCSNEKISLRGGLSQNGRPMELIREKDGKELSLNEGVSSKRALSDDEMDEDEVKRSMARRRKSDKAGDVVHVCRDCKKEFKRPCDLTKHEKTHSRPWKCSEEKCKYFDLGWPTEKERDRHMNDKHSAAPPQHKCQYPPCTYVSKRESNCKQHMEKAHGWEYVRSKSNGRKKAKVAGNENAPPTPLTPFLGTPQSASLATPITPFAPSPLVPMGDTFDTTYGFGTPALSMTGFQDEFRRDSLTTDGSSYTYSSGPSPTEPTSFDDAVTPEDTSINHNPMLHDGGFGALNANFNTAFQQPTPAMSTGFDFDHFAFGTCTSAAPGMSHLSPAGQADMTLSSPHMNLDEGFNEGMATYPPMEDFALYENPQPNDMTLNNTAAFFPEINQLGGQFDNNFFPEPTTTMDDLNMMNDGYGNQ